MQLSCKNIYLLLCQIKPYGVLKLLSIILSFYVIVLTLTPCVDDYLSSNIAKSEISQQQNESNSSDIDLCSPFCTCNCCGASITIVLKTFFTPDKPISAILNFFHADKKLTDKAHSFWQPPKIY